MTSTATTLLDTFLRGSTHLEAWTTDRSQVLKVENGKLHISGTAQNAEQSWLMLRLDGQLMGFSVGPGMTPVDVARKIQRHLTTGYEVNLASDPDVIDAAVVVEIVRWKVFKTPRVVCLSNDPDQVVTSLGRNQFEILGTATDGGEVPSFIEIQVNERPFEIRLKGGETAAVCADRLLATLPARYRGSVVAEGPRVIVTLLEARHLA